MTWHLKTEKKRIVIERKTIHLNQGTKNEKNYAGTQKSWRLLE
jgi:hypothetical protein